MDVKTGEGLLSIEVANMEPIYWLVCSFTRKGRDGTKGLMGVSLTCEFHFTR